MSTRFSLHKFLSMAFVVSVMASALFGCAPAAPTSAPQGGSLGSSPYW